MRRMASEKIEIMRLAEGADLPVLATLRQLGVPRSTFYGWHQQCEEIELGCLHDKAPEQDPTGGARRSARHGARTHGPFTTRAGLLLRRLEALLRVRIERVPALEGCRSDYEPGLRADERLGLLPASDRSCPRDVADRLHNLPHHRLGLVPPNPPCSTLLALNHRLEAEPNDGRDGCHGGARPGDGDHEDWNRFASSTDCGFSATTVLRMCQASFASVSANAAWYMPAAVRITRGPTAKSSAITGR